VKVFQPVVPRFWSKVQKTDGCWPWIGGIEPLGYGRLKIGGRAGRWVKAHRFAYELLVGPIPSGLDLDHLCHNADPACPGGKNCIHRRCVNPAHLEPVTHRENVLRGQGFAAQQARRTHCPQGHPYDSANTYVDASRRRHCRACKWGQR
jgi:HNH endonuclease